MSLMNRKVYFFPKKEMYRMNVGRIVGCGWNENRDKQGRIFKKKKRSWSMCTIHIDPTLTNSQWKLYQPKQASS